MSIRRWFDNFFDNRKISEQLKIFNVVHFICVIAMLFIIFIVGYFIEDKRALYLSFGLLVSFIMTIVEANRTGKMRIPIIIMSIVFNVIYMPIIFLLFDRFVCAIPLYFIAGLIYNVLLLDIKTSFILCAIEFCYYLGIIIYAYLNFEVTIIGLSEHEIYIRYFATLIGTLIAGICAGASVRFRYLYYRRTYIMADELRKKSVDAYIAKDMFLVNMSHEIRTPMNAIVGTVDLLLEQDISDQVSDSVYNILNSCNALLSITDEIMDLSKSESGKVEIYETHYCLSDLLIEITNMVNIRLNDSPVSFLVDINKDIPKNLYGDASKIRQLFVNLLNNSAKFTTEGNIILRVDYRALTEESIELIVDVEDTGLGIPKDKLPYVFDRGNEISYSVSQEEKAGFGLAVCSDIVNSMGGEISVQSKFHSGSVFTFKVPQKIGGREKIAELSNVSEFYCLIYDYDEAHSVYASNLLKKLSVKCDIARHKQDFERLMSANKYTHVFIDNNNEECNAYFENILLSSKIVALLDCDDNINIKKANYVLNRPLNIINLVSLLKNETNNFVREIGRKGRLVCPKANILVVDDNYTNLNVATAILGKFEANVYNAASGRDCLRVIEDTNIDLVFLDYMMPEMNGIDTLEAIRKIPGSKYAALPVIALTANVISGARERFLEAGFDDFMAKPISIDKVEKAIKKYLPNELIEYNDVLE